ncbi:hypothetical protein BD310DRAFT_984973 [Dichomitus squalens]|uniref:Uncharacterized protein n=1 Tax=Dichomitus squalens TaxID=114155 RepID=A0A4Q9QF24_9APHY|nr:hypothetical protein BD310DRAFT_984973 [Dichomitus squalens]
MPSVDIELDDFSHSRAQLEDTTTLEPLPNPNSHKDDGVVSSWAWTSAIILLLAAAPLILYPKLLLFLSETGLERRVSLTPLESFLAWNTGIVLIVLAVALVYNIHPGHEILNPKRSGPPDHPLLEPMTSACLLISFLSYNTSSVSSLGFLVCLGSGTIGLWGLWAILFAGSSYISRKTGADKRTSRFIFGNKAAASSKKKEWKKEQARRS